MLPAKSNPKIYGDFGEKKARLLTNVFEHTSNVCEKTEKETTMLPAKSNPKIYGDFGENKAASDERFRAYFKRM